MAQADITPRERVWLSGFAARNRTADGTMPLQEGVPLQARVLAVRRGHVTLVFVALDLIGIDATLSGEVFAALQRAHGLRREHVRLCVSHTHSGPVVGRNLWPLAPEQAAERKKIERYAAFLVTSIVSVVGNAITPQNFRTAHGYFSKTRCDMAVNRRQIRESDFDGVHRGMTDTEVPVLWFVDSANHAQIIAGAFGYAAHATVLTREYQYSGDYPGATSSALERLHPSSVWLYLAGCGGDQNVYPRGTVSRLRQHRKVLVDAVERLVSGKSGHVRGLPLDDMSSDALAARHKTIRLPFRTRRTVRFLRGMLRSSEPTEANAAKLLLASGLEADGKGTRATYDYPISAWHLGGQVLVFLGGEPTVEYAFRLRDELNVSWVIGYTDDVMGYVGSASVIREGKREGSDRAAYYYGLPSAWAEDVEKVVIDGIRNLVL